ncbi:MAG: hypothetical protein WBI65_01590 [Dethiobacteria bacterium]
MELWRYDDYLTVSEDFIPVFSEDVDKNKKDNWKSFIPHTYMKDMLQKLIVALERSHSKDKLSLWLTGAYGTGKTYASFVIKHLLEDPLEEVEDYLLKHKILSSLWPRLKALRDNNLYLVVYRSSSGQITTSRRLMIEVQQAIKDQLRARGYTNAFSESIMDQLVRKLDDSRRILNWENIFNEYRGRFRTAASAAEVIDRLHAGDMKLGEQVAEVLEEEGQTLIDSPGDIKAWIKEVIAVNNLQGIVFIWDEFTEFFTNNVPVTPLQELAQATADMPFYLFLITHKSVSQFTRIDDDTRRKLMERFHNCRLEMAPVTAYKLIGNVIEADPNLRDDWEAKRDSLWSQVDETALHINIFGEKVSKEELKLLPPIHPFSAYLLATISSLYSSSQRTFFRFLKEKELGSFQWFVANHPRDDWYWLTPDYLWQYFFEETKIEDIEGISDVLSHYNAVKDHLNHIETRIFRVIMLLTALQRQTEGAHALLRPRLSIIKRMFIGTTIHNQVEEITEKLRSQNIVLDVPSGDDYEYIIPRATIDQNKIRLYQQQAETSLTMEKMISVEKSNAEFAPRLKELLLLQGATKLRCPIQIVSGKQLKHRRERIIQGVENPYEIGVILVVAQEDGHLIDTDHMAKKITLGYPDYCIMISQMPFGSKRWREWLKFRARSWYYEEMRDNNMKKYYDTKAEGIVTEWLNTVRISQVKAFFQGKQEELAGCQAIPGYLDDIVETVFPDGPEKIDRTATLYTNPWGKTGAEIGLQVAISIQRPYRDVVDELGKQGLWEEGGLSRHSSHPVAKMKRELDSFFNSQDYVNINDLWKVMQQPPYGLMPSPIGILLFSFLLKSYATGYYYSDGVNSLALNPNKLAVLIHDVLKGIGSFENYTIRKMSTEGEEFCRMARDIFHLTAEQTAYPEEARKNMIAAIIELGYPLWTVSYYSQEIYDLDTAQHIREAITTLGNALVYDRAELDDPEMKVIVDAIYPKRYHLRQYLSRDRMRDGMRKFWELYAPRLQILCEDVGLEETQVMSRLRLLLSEDVNMWREDRVRDKLPAITKELDLVYAMNLLCETRKQDLETIRYYFRANWFNSKLPLLSHREGQPDDVAGLIDYIYALFYDPGHIPQENRAEEIRTSRHRISIALKSSVSVIGVLVEKYTGQKISDQEAAQLYTALPDLSEAAEDEVREAIVSALSQLARQKKLVVLKQQWQKLTGSESPTIWSEQMRTPIQWVLEGRAHHTFFTQYARCQQLSEREIDEAIAHLSEHSSEFAVLQDRQYVLNRFIEVAAGDYADLVKQSDNAGIVRDYVYKALHGNVHEWPHRLSEVNQKTRQWVHDNYRSSAYPRLIKVIDKMSPSDMKGFIKELVSKDALVGVRLLAAIQDKR